MINLQNSSVLTKRECYRSTQASVTQLSELSIESVLWGTRYSFVWEFLA